MSCQNFLVKLFSSPISIHTWWSWSFLCFFPYFLLSADMLSNFTGCFSYGVSVRRTICWYAFKLYWVFLLWCVLRRTLFCPSLLFGCICFYKSKVSLLIGKIPFQKLFARNLMTAFSFTAWKVSVFGVILVRIQSKWGKIRTRITTNTDTFFAAISSMHK